MKSLRDLALNGEDEPEEPKKQKGLWDYEKYDPKSPSYVPPAYNDANWPPNDGYLGRVERKEKPDVSQKFVVYIKKNVIGDIADEDHPSYNVAKMMTIAENIAREQLKLIAGIEVEQLFKLTFEHDEFWDEVEVGIQIAPK